MATLTDKKASKEMRHYFMRKLGLTACALVLVISTQAIYSPSFGQQSMLFDEEALVNALSDR